MSSVVENTIKKQQGFAKGYSGNPNGRPKGALNNTTKAALALLEGEAEAISRKAIELALGGDIQAIKLLIERTIPVRKERTININLPGITNVDDVMVASKKVIASVACGELTPSEGHGLMGLLENVRLAIDTSEFEQRIKRLEEANNAKH